MSDKLPKENILKHLAIDVQMLKSAAEIVGTGNPCSRDGEVRKILARTAELVRGVTALGQQRNLLTLSIVVRAILENLIVLLWILVSEENAQQQSMASQAESRRIARINLEKGNMRIRSRATGEDATAEFLASGSPKGDRSKNLDQCAREAGVLSLYDAFYRPLSMAVHVHGFDADEGDDEPESEAELHAARAFAKAIGHAGMRWLVHRQRTDNEALREVLGLNGR